MEKRDIHLSLSIDTNCVRNKAPQRTIRRGPCRPLGVLATLFLVLLVASSTQAQPDDQQIRQSPASSDKPENQSDPQENDDQKVQQSPSSSEPENQGDPQESESKGEEQAGASPEPESSNEETTTEEQESSGEEATKGEAQKNDRDKTATEEQESSGEGATKGEAQKNDRDKTAAEEQKLPTPRMGGNDLSAGLEDLSLVDLLRLDLRVATTKTNTTVQASPAAVTVISREEIERYGYRSVAEALRDVVGTYAVDDHITPNLGVRGAPGAAFEGSGAVKVMIDGVPVAFRTTGENWLGPALVPMASVERIEIVKGPTSSLYGADAFLGVINVITKDAGHDSWGEVGGGAMSTYSGKPGFRAEAASGHVMRPWRLTLGAQYDQENRSGLPMPSSSPAPSLAEGAANVSRAQQLRSGVGRFKLSYTPTRQTSYSLSGRYARQQSAAEFAPWLQFTNVPGGETGTRLSLQQGTLTLQAESSLTREFRIEATGTGFFGGTLPDDRIDTGDTLAVVHRDLSYYGGEGTIEGIVQPVDHVRLVLGVEATADREHLGAPDYRSREDGSPLPSAGTAEDFETTLLNVAGRAQLTWDIIPQYLVPTGGLRFDHNSVYGNRLSGRLAVVSQLYDNLYLKSAYGTAFKAATPLLLYGRPLTIGDVIGSPELGPQEMRSWEFTADYRPESLFDLEVTVSQWDLIDRAVFRPEQINLVARNAADATGWTIEGRATSRFSDYVGGMLGYEWVRVMRQSGEIGYREDLFGTAPAIYPEFIARGRLWVRPKPAPIELWAASNIVGPRNASDSNTLEAGERYVLPTYATLDAGVRTVDLTWIDDKLTEFSLRAQNITDTAGTDAGFFGIDYPAAPPKVLLEVRQEL